MDYYRSGCFPVGSASPGTPVIFGLMSTLTTPDGVPPSQLALQQGAMVAGVTGAPSRHAREILIYLLAGAVLARVGDEKARLLADSCLRIPDSTEYQFSTSESTGMAAVVIIPRQEASSAQDLESWRATREPGGLAIIGEPILMAWESLDILRDLSPLTSEGCHLAMVEMVRGSNHRNRILASLLLQYADNPRALRALIWACNGHPAAPWWLNRQRAQTELVATIGKLLTH